MSKKKSPWANMGSDSESDRLRRAAKGQIAKEDGAKDMSDSRDFYAGLAGKGWQPELGEIGAQIFAEEYEKAMRKMLPKGTSVIRMINPWQGVYPSIEGDDTLPVKDLTK